MFLKSYSNYFLTCQVDRVISGKLLYNLNYFSAKTILAITRYFFILKKKKKN